MRVPIEFTASFFEDFLNITLGEQLYYGRFTFGNDDSLPHDYFQYYSNVHTAKLFSDLTGKYDGFTHVLQPSVRYVKPGAESQSPLHFEKLLSEQPQVKDLFSVGLPEEQFIFSLNQYFYDESMKLIFFQRLSQSYYQNREYELADLKNEMGFNWRNWSFYSNLYYSFEFDDISESSTSISLKEHGYKISVGHTFKQLLTDTTKMVTANDVSFDFKYEYNERVAINGGMIYDVEEGTSRLWRVGGSYTRDCWSVAASVSADVKPRPSTIAGVMDYTQEYGFFIQLNFIPFASINSAQLDTLVATP
jgi:LPS-assembly protein